VLEVVNVVAQPAEALQVMEHLPGHPRKGRSAHHPQHDHGRFLAHGPPGQFPWTRSPSTFLSQSLPAPPGRACTKYSLPRNSSARSSGRAYRRWFGATWVRWQRRARSLAGRKGRTSHTALIVAGGTPKSSGFSPHRSVDSPRAATAVTSSRIRTAGQVAK